MPELAAQTGHFGDKMGVFGKTTAIDTHSLKNTLIQGLSITMTTQHVST